MFHLNIYWNSHTCALIDLLKIYKPLSIISQSACEALYTEVTKTFIAFNFATLTHIFFDFLFACAPSICTF